MDQLGKTSYSLPHFREAIEWTIDLYHLIDGSFAIRKDNWKLCLSAGSGGWSHPKESEAKQKGLSPMQLFDLSQDKAEKTIIHQETKKVKELLQQA